MKDFKILIINSYESILILTIPGILYLTVGLITSLFEGNSSLRRFQELNVPSNLQHEESHCTSTIKLTKSFSLLAYKI